MFGRVIVRLLVRFFFLLFLLFVFVFVVLRDSSSFVKRKWETLVALRDQSWKQLTRVSGTERETRERREEYKKREAERRGEE